jgi:lipopolysaccharide assembly protein A
MRVLIALPFLILLVLFALSNRTPVRIGLWPADYALEVPLSAAVLVTMALAFLFGAVLVWASTFGLRRRARHAEYAVRLLEEQVQELKSRVRRPAAPSSAQPLETTDGLREMKPTREMKPQMNTDKAIERR